MFVRVKAPHRALTPRRGHAGRRRGRAARRARAAIHAHRLRHTAATELLRAGAPLAEIGQLLRHRRPLTTAIYAKVDRERAARARAAVAGRCGMTALAQALDDYLAIRRALGFKLERAEKLLAQFLAYLDERGADTVTTELALAWATLPARRRPSWWAHRLSVVRGFAALPAHARPRDRGAAQPICCPGGRGAPRPTSTPTPRSPR